ncbi:MAG: hypothetical protein LBP34_06345 [Flavobacteriaceae bacterium]|jgi:Spy/CpxP family protein refolding chaperone|nr:hypothetical protein [Flavobacteriaceae bacterium]
MKKILFIGALILTSGFAFSQNRGEKGFDKPKDIENKGEKVKILKDRMTKELNLTEEQIKQINAIDDKYKTQAESLKKQIDTLQQKRYRLNKEKKVEVEKILTDEQKKKLAEIKAKAFEKKHDEKKHDERKDRGRFDDRK